MIRRYLAGASPWTPRDARYRSALRGRALALLVLVAFARAALASDPPDPRRVLHILRYISRDYVGAYKTKEKDELEEQVEFLEAAQAALRALPEKPGRDAVSSYIDAMIALVKHAAKPDDLNVVIGLAASRISQLYPCPLVPPKHHDPKTGKRLYTQACASCHGKEGRCETQAARAMKPHPARLAGRDAKHRLTAAVVYDTVTFGVTGTPMPGYRDVLSEQDRWEIAYHVLTFKK